MPAWDGTPWMRWARARARCPGPRAPLHGRVSPHNTHLPHDISSSFTQRNTELYSAWIHSSCVCSLLTDPERDDEDFLYLTSEQDWDYFGQVESCDLKHCRVGRKGGERRVAEGRQCKEDRAGVKTCDSSGRGGLEGGLFVSRCTAGWLTVWVQAVSWIQRDTETMKSRGRVVHFNMYNAFFFFFLFVHLHMTSKTRLKTAETKHWSQSSTEICSGISKWVDPNFYELASSKLFILDYFSFFF